MSAPQTGSTTKKASTSHKGSKKNRKAGKLKLPGAGINEPPEGSIYSSPGGAQKSVGQKPVSSGSLLEEVLNEKKIELMRSPEVMKFLQGMQSKVAVEKAVSAATQPAPEVTRARRRYASGEPRLTSLTGSRPTHATHRSLSEPQVQLAHTSVSESAARESPQPMDTSQTGTAPLQLPASPMDTNKVIWSKDASAFSSVSSGNDPPS